MCNSFTRHSSSDQFIYPEANITGKIETHKITAVVSPVCSRLLCQRRSSRTRWGRRPLGTGPCWRQSEDRSSHKLHPPLSPASYGWLPSLQEDTVEDGELRIKEPHANDEVESEVQLLQPSGHYTMQGHTYLWSFGEYMQQTMDMAWKQECVVDGDAECTCTMQHYSSHI